RRRLWILRDRGPAVLAFRVLLAPPRLVQADLFSLHFSRVPGNQARRAERGLEPRIILDQRARQPVAHRARLPVLAAAVHVDGNVEARLALGDLQRLAHDHAPGLAREELVDGLAVDEELALARFQEDARHGALAPARAVVVVADHFRAPVLSAAAPNAGVCRPCRSSASSAWRSRA